MKEDSGSNSRNETSDRFKINKQRVSRYVKDV